ncbi:pyridoxamine 5'-phosphate oxidase family protein [Euzebya tangerina]|uniref:pyridoxamine 5'-phosphate oxidase family protein n=1 Tax=Euzebya tangerina TaxID=591198 RepID=UPI000E31E887|nr:pyridoxamine 5'-phosphate oxidase family protein [Euzebya tangerina]
MSDASIDRPDMPDGYGVPDTDDGLLTWSSVEERLVAAQHYWLSSTRPDGRPHSVPRWGVWVDGAFWYDGAPTTRHVQNVNENPAVTLHLEDGEKAVIIDGQSVMSTPVTGALGQTLSAAFIAKYGAAGYEPEPDAWSDEIAGGLRIIRPLKVLAWTSFPTDVTRFTFATTEAIDPI